MIRKDLWDDDIFSMLSLPARLLYIALITCSDDEGCFRADAKYWKRIVFYSLKISVSRVDKMLQELCNANLIVIGQAKKGVAGYIPNWHDIQSLRADRSKPSEYSDLLVANGLTPCFTVAAQDKRTEENIIEDKINEVNNYQGREIMLSAMGERSDFFKGFPGSKS